MSSSTAKANKKVTKLSLTKKAQNKEPSKCSSVLPVLVDLNETCEFKDPASFTSVGDGRTRRHINSTKDTDVSEDGIDKEDEVTCHVCNKQLSHMSTQRRQQHVNRCIDKMEEVDKVKQEDAALLETAKTAILDCPICGKHFKSDKSRVSHMKKCSTDNAVSTDHVIQLVKDQEVERQTLVAAGVVPATLRISKPKTTFGSKKRKLKEPKNKYEEDVQVAMAISSSLIDPQQSVSCDLIGQNNETGVIAGNKTKRNRKKNALDDVCLLTTLTAEDRHRRIEEKLNTVLLHENYNGTSLHSSPLFTSALNSYTHSMTSTSQHGHSLWTRCYQGCDTTDTHTFYVPTLMPPVSISTVSPGSKVKHMSSIPGREVSFVANKSYADVKTVERSFGVADDIITASTQTAVVLAELAVDDGDITQHSKLGHGNIPDPMDIDDDDVGGSIIPSPVSDSPPELQASGFCVERLTLKKTEQDVLQHEALQAYKSLINNREHSDMTISTTDRQTLHAHKVILATRCPKLLQITSDSSSIELDATSDVVLSLLTFVYTGELTLHPSDQLPVTNLADMLEFHTLKDACSRLINEENLENLENDDNDIFDNKCDMEVSKFKDEFVESKLDMKEIWGESSDSESEVEGQGHNTDQGNHGNSSSEIDNEEYHDIMCTQKQHLKTMNENESMQNERLETEKDVKMDDNEINEEVKLCNRDEVGNENKEIDTDDGNINNPGKAKKKFELLDLTLDSGSEQTDSETELDKMPSPKRIRYSSEKEYLGIGFDTSVGCLNKENKQEGFITSADNPDKGKDENEESKLNESYHVGNISKAMNVSTPGFNNSSADLFGSPSPTVGNSFVKSKPYERIDQITPIVESETIKSSTPIECQSPTFSKKLKQNLNNDSLFITPVPISRKTCKSRNLVGQDLSTHKLDTFSTNASHNEQKALLNSFENINDMNEELDNNSDKYSTANCDKNDNNNSDDDLEITGDNFDDFSQNSPTFKDLKSKTKSKSDGKVVSPSAGMSRTLDDVTDKPDSGDDIEEDNGDISHYFDESFSAMDGVLSVDIDHDIEQNKISDKNYCDDSETVRNIDYDNNNSGVTICSNIPSSDREVTFDTAVNLVESDTNDSECNDLNDDLDKSLNDLDEDVIELKSSDCNTCTPYLNSKSVVKSSGKDNGMKRKSMHGKHEISVYNSEDNDVEGDESVDRNHGYDDVGDRDGHVRNQVPSDTEQDVWVDFDDCGLEYIPPVESPGESPPLDTMEKNVSVTMETAHDNMEDSFLQAADDSFVFNIDNNNIDNKQEEQPPTVFNAPQVKVGKFKTPTASGARSKKPQGPWVPPSPFTPKPQYDQMATPVLKKAVQKLGVKAVSKKRMVKLLDDVYHQTHQYETDSECEVEPETTTGQTKDPFQPSSSTSNITHKPDKAPKPSKTTHKRSKTTITAPVMDRDDDCALSQGDVSSQDSDASSLFEESCLHPPSSDSDTAGSPQKGVDVHKQIYNYIKQNADLNMRILMYEPLELDVLKKDIKEAGIKCSLDKLMDFLDERCIAFTTKNNRNKPRGKRGKKKATTKQDGKS